MSLLQVSVEKVVPAPADRIFDLLADPRRHAELDGSGTVQGVVDGPDRLSQGAVFGMDMKMGGSYQMVSTVVEFEENRRIAWQPRPTSAAARKLAGGRIWRYELEPVEGGTLVRETWDIRQERIPPLVWGYRFVTRGQMAKTLDRLEEIVR
jgi:uncharacterized protein YndB with AHSA1/START domain